MTQKERKLGMVAGGMFAVFLVYMVVQRLLLGPISDLRTEVGKSRTDLATLQSQAQMAGNYRRMWTDLNARTLAGDKELAAGKLDQLIKNLLSESGLQRFTVNPGEIKPSKDKKYAVIPYTVVGVEGDLQAFARFLHKFYQQPYAMQITGFNLEPLSFRGKGGALRISSLVIEALFLPTEGLPASLAAASAPASSPATRLVAMNTPATRPVALNRPATRPGSPKVPGAATQPVMAEAPATRPATVMGRSKHADPQAYAILWDKKFMEPYTEPPPIPRDQGPKIVPVAMPAISPGGGNFTGPTSVTITCSVPGATIRYTTDGTDPSLTSGQVYSGPVQLTSAGMVKAIACTEDKRTSSVAVASFSVPPPPPLRLVMLDNYDDVHEAVVVNEQDKQQPSQIIREGEEMDGGRLVLVLPQAAVVQMPEGPLYVYWLGKPFKDKEILDKARQPGVWKLVKDQVAFE